MEDKKSLNVLAALIIAQPIYDIVIYLLNNILNINIPFISFIRPLIAIFTYLYLLFSLRVLNSHKKYPFIYLSIYVAFCLIHIINVKSNFFTLSYGSLTSELRYLFNYGYFLLQFINFYIIFDILNENERKYLLKSIICAVVVMILLYFVSILTNTSPKTYMYSTTKNGWRGWSVSAHYVGHAIIYMLPSFIYALFEKNYIKKWYKYLIIVLLVIPSFYLVGTKATLFSTLFIILFYSFIRIINSVKNKSLDKDSLFFISLSIILIITFKFTFGYSNFK